jgi:hypothetical protein
VLLKGPVVRVLLVCCCSIEPWVCPCANNEVLDFPRIIAKVEIMNMTQENPKENPETKIMTKSQEESENVLLQIRETLNDH